MVLMGHMSASNIIVASEDFYKFNVDKIIRSDQNISEPTEPSQSDSQSRSNRRGADIAAKEKRYKRRKDLLMKDNFSMNISMFPSGEKIYKIILEQPKVLARADIFLMVGDFFKSGFPQYTRSSSDKPNGWTDDPNSVRRQEIILEMRQAFICFENEERAKTTVVCAGNMILTKNRENINQSKLKLLDRMEKVHGPGSVSSNPQKLLLNGSNREEG